MAIVKSPFSGRKLHDLLVAAKAIRTLNQAAIWRAQSFAASAGQPMTVRRALALNAVLERCDLLHVPGELLFGSPFGHLAVHSDAVATQIDQASAQLASIGRRDFYGHSDHLAPDYEGLLAVGLTGLLQKVRHELDRPRDDAQREFLRSVELAVEGAAAHIRRWAAHLESLAAADPEHRDLLLEQARMAQSLSGEPPCSFWEAIQLAYVVHTLFSYDDRNHMAFGRLDHYLQPFYQADLAAGRLDRAGAVLLLEHFCAKLTSLGEVQNIALGGLTRDGADATNEVSCLILEACQAVGQPGANLTARIHKRTPREFLTKCAQVIRTGIGYPAMVNDEILVPALVEQGCPLEDARDYCFVGCIETFMPGRTAPWADTRLNLLYCVNLVIFGGIDSLTGKPEGLPTAPPRTWDEFYRAFLAQIRHRLQLHVKTQDDRQLKFDSRPAEFTSPLMSALVRDCIARGRDMNDGGSVYPANHGIAAMGIGVTADALAAVKKFVYDDAKFTLQQLREMLLANFAGFEPQRQALLNQAPKFGNNLDEVDRIAADVTREVGLECLKYRTPQGGRYWALMAANVANIYAGLEVGATPDGRLARQPLSDASSPTFGRDLHGPTAVIQSIAKLPYRCCPGGNVVNMRLSPSCLRGRAGLENLAGLVRTCFDMGGAQLQFNSVDTATLRKAIERPEDYRDLVVRVSGFSANFIGMDRPGQEDVIRRTQHELR